MGTRAREQARELRQARELAARRRRQRARVLGIGGTLIGVLVAAIVISLVAVATKGDAPTDRASAQPMVAPTVATANGALLVGKATAPVTLAVYVDYLCPFCGRFERANGGELDKLIGAGTVRLELHPLAFLDRMSNGTRYSTRTANAIVTVAQSAPEQLLAFHGALFASQPEENTDGLTNDQIAQLALGAGVPEEVVNVLARGTYESWIAQSTAAAFSAGITGTPTVKINGAKFNGDLYSVGPLTEAITAAAKVQR